ncbi:MAG: hypothetical protein GY859_33405, partial [Desulfobacterales bacterium]|nr:hypothetical protein [Desulfobacterales bacterium]
FEIGKNMMHPGTRISPSASGEGSLPVMVAGYEKRIIGQAMKKAKSIRKTAMDLGISHTALLNKLKKYKIKVETFRTAGNNSNHP